MLPKLRESRKVSQKEKKRNVRWGEINQNTGAWNPRDSTGITWSDTFSSGKRAEDGELGIWSEDMDMLGERKMMMWLKNSCFLSQTCIFDQLFLYVVFCYFMYLGCTNTKKKNKLKQKFWSNKPSGLKNEAKVEPTTAVLLLKSPPEAGARCLQAVLVSGASPSS